MNVGSFLSGMLVGGFIVGGYVVYKKVSGGSSWFDNIKF
jgi:hypothetical protein